ncbi:hypothetical protein LUZ60_005810 [Juncus effusus]|nr:hypothetical protein LUZ60_005810 [Juncus effusus]
MANSSLNQYNVSSISQKEKEKEDDLIIKPLRPGNHVFLSIENSDSPYKDIILSLPPERRWLGRPLRKYQGFWLGEGGLPAIISLQNSFKPRQDDIFVASFPKCGTTWLKAITFAIINRNRYNFASHPLLRINPHDCVKFIEFFFPEGNQSYLESLPSPRVLSLHTPYSLLPDVMKASECKIVYICRDPKDAIVSNWHMNKIFLERDQQFPFSQAFELFVEGRVLFGPIWEHMLEFWNQSLKNTQKILFLKYEDLLENPLEWVKKIADFLGCSFSKEEEMNGVPKKIVELCSFKSLTNLSVNQKKDETVNLTEMNDIFFRKGVKGDWKNHMSLEMANRLDAITREKCEGSGLSFASSVMKATNDSN